MELRRKATATATVLSAAAASAILAAPAASAWSWSSTVTLTGTNGCGGIQSASVAGVLNEQRRSWTGQDYANYSITFTNVPSGGGWAWLWSDCGVSNDHGTWVRVYRPSWGSTIRADLGSAY